MPPHEVITPSGPQTYIHCITKYLRTPPKSLAKLQHTLKVSVQKLRYTLHVLVSASRRALYTDDAETKPNFVAICSAVTKRIWSPVVVRNMTLSGTWQRLTWRWHVQLLVSSATDWGHRAARLLLQPEIGHDSFLLHLFFACFNCGYSLNGIRASQNEHHATGGLLTRTK